MLDAVGYNSDYVEDRFIPDGMMLTAFVAEDALRHCEWLSLVGPGGAVTAAGARIAHMARTPYGQHGEGQSRAPTKILAVRTRRHYLGADNLPLTDLPRAAGAVLASHGRRWPASLGGSCSRNWTRCCTGDFPMPMPRRIGPSTCPSSGTGRSTPSAGPGARPAPAAGWTSSSWPMSSRSPTGAPRRSRSLPN